MANEEERESFLREANVAVLASVGPGGGAQAAPVWYLYEDGTFLINTDRGSQKHRNIERNPEVTLVIDLRTPPFYAVMAQGRAEIGPRFSDEQRMRLYTRYLGEEIARQFFEMRSGEDAVSIRLTPRKIIEFDPRAGL
jgi:PPOX class probable F420-dependent enzyme